MRMNWLAPCIALSAVLASASGLWAQVALELDLASSGGKLVGRVVGTDAGKDLTGETYVVSQKFEHALKAPGTEFVPGLVSTWVNGNHTNDDAWTAGLANKSSYIAPPFLLDKISYGGDTPNDYPALSGIPAGSNRDTYSAQFEGEIFIPEGTVSFWDGNDDYTKLVIDGETLIDDNDWTAWTGKSDNDANTVGDTGSFVGTKNDVTVEGLKGGWYPITFRGAEGGGGDNFRLVWDASDGTKGQTGPDIDAVYINPDAEADTFFTVAGPFFRAIDPGVVIERVVPLGVLGLSPAGLAGNDGLGSKGVNVEVPLNGADIVLTGTQTLLLTASVNGVTETLEKDVAFSGGSTLPGDIDGNGKVDLTDFGILKENFGKSGGAAVPEPSSLLLLALGGLGGLLFLARSKKIRT